MRLCPILIPSSRRLRVSALSRASHSRLVDPRDESGQRRSHARRGPSLPELQWCGRRIVPLESVSLLQLPAPLIGTRLPVHQFCRAAFHSTTQGKRRCLTATNEPISGAVTRRFSSGTVWYHFPRLALRVKAALRQEDMGTAKLRFPNVSEEVETGATSAKLSSDLCSKPSQVRQLAGHRVFGRARFIPLVLSKPTRPGPHRLRA